MSCCGDRRAAQRAAGAQLVRSGAPAPVREPPTGPTTFEYVGPRAIQVVGPSTGAVYRFAGKGARVPVHRADAASVAAVPGLKPVAFKAPVPGRR
jgi:hypothetical protein